MNRRERLLTVAASVIILIAALADLKNMMHISAGANEAFSNIYIEVGVKGEEMSFDRAGTPVVMTSFRISEQGVSASYYLKDPGQLNEEIERCCPEAVMKDGTVVKADQISFAFDSVTGDVRTESLFPETVDLSSIVSLKFGRIYLPLIK